MLLAKRDRPTAVVSLSDEAAIGALRAADIAGVNVPEEMAVMGYDDKPPAAYARVPLSTMHQPDDAIGAEAVSLLIDRINGHLPRSPVVRALPTELVIRESCGSRRATSSTP